VSFLLDTCVLSESTRPTPDKGVVTWLADTPEGIKHISVLSLAEVKFGILCAPTGQRRVNLETWYEQILRPSVVHRLIPFGELEALKWAEIKAANRSAPVLDCQIAATALAHGLTLVTRNVRDFRFARLPVFNPWAK